MLIVDDEALVRWSIRAHLEAAGCTVAAAGAHGHLGKPFDLDEVLEEVERLAGTDR